MTNQDKARTPLEKKLLAIAFADHMKGMEGSFLPDICDSEPLEAYSAYNWQSFVDADIRALWGELDFGQKLITFIHASQRASDAGDYD